MKQASRNHPLLSVLLAMVLLPLLAVPAYAGGHSARPQWLRKGEAQLNAQRTNDTYYFKMVHNIGTDLTQLRQASTSQLADFIGKRNQIEGLEMTEISNATGTAGTKTREQYDMVFRNRFSTDAFYAQLVDEYWEPDATGYNYYALYAVSASGSVRPSFDRFEATRSYGALPALMSVVPGVGQLYKGQKLKGCLMLGGAAAGAGAIILCENRRAYYQTRIGEEPKFAHDYSKKRDNWETGRNIAIGATAALMVWSIVDAAVAPGATRIRLSASSSLAFRPAALATPSGMGMGASLSFNF